MYIYTVQQGDTLTQLARRFGSTVELILAANDIADPDVIEAEQFLKIPVPGPIRVRVQAGDSLWSISRRYDVKVEVLAAANNLTAPFTIFPGQILVVPAVTPDSIGCITWLSDRTGRPDIFVRSPMRPVARQVTRFLALESSIPKWSPDGTRIAFVGRDNALWVVDPATLNAEVVIENVPLFEDFDWSSDSTTIAFSRINATPMIISISVLTGETAFITQGREVSYLPDGRRLLFESDRTGLSQLYIINTDGTGLRQVSRNTEPGRIQAVSLSPDGNRAAFTFPGNGVSFVRILNLATGETYNTPAGDLQQDFNPVWSPDGSFVAYNSSTDEAPRGLRGIVRLVDPSGIFLRDLTDSACFGGRIAVDPLGRYVLYSNCVGQIPQLTAVPLLGLPIQITSIGNNENPDWSSTNCPNVMY